nr:glycine-rich cell wall structural protein 1.8-like [Aegilops tauschii subsp. strangulata]
MGYGRAPFGRTPRGTRAWALAATAPARDGRRGATRPVRGGGLPLTGEAVARRAVAGGGRRGPSRGGRAGGECGRGGRAAWRRPALARGQRAWAAVKQGCVVAGASVREGRRGQGTGWQVRPGARAPPHGLGDVGAAVAARGRACEGEVGRGQRWTAPRGGRRGRGAVNGYGCAASVGGGAVEPPGGATAGPTLWCACARSTSRRGKEGGGRGLTAGA